MKTVKVDHAVLTIRLSPSGAGMTKQEVDELVNKRLTEGYDQVDTFVVRSNFDERGSASDIVILYIFKQNVVDDEAAVKASRKS